MELSDEQENMISEIMKFSKPIIRCGGFAGTGKTTVISHLHANELQNFAVCAYTGKAANVLRKKQLPATTIHSLIYKPKTDPEGRIIIGPNGPIFELAPSLPCDGIIIDEASMVSKEIYRDLCSFNIPLIFVGDHGQLEPVGEGMNLMADPDITLEHIHRNAGEIAFFAEHIRKGFRAASWTGGKKVKFSSKWDAEKHFHEVDQVICAYNKTRVMVNRTVRAKLGHPNDFPVVGDKIMCLRNDNRHGLFNGMQGTIKFLYTKPKNRMAFDSNDVEIETLFDPKVFNCEKPEIDHDRDAPAPFDYAYAITAHKSQGDEFSSVMVLEQRCKLWEHKRWAYTAASRAKDQVIWVADY